MCPLYVAVRQCAFFCNIADDLLWLRDCLPLLGHVRLSALVGACQIVCPCCGMSDCLPLLQHIRLSTLVAAHQIVCPCGMSDCLTLLLQCVYVCCFFLLCCVFERHARFTSGIWLYRCVLYLDYRWNNDKVWCNY